MIAGVCLSVCRMLLRPNSNFRMERPRKQKISSVEAHHTGNLWTYLEVKEQDRPIIAVTDNAPYVGGFIKIFLELANIKI